MKIPQLSLRGALLAGWVLYGLLCAAFALARPSVAPHSAVALRLWLLVPTMLTTLAVPALARRLHIVHGRILRGLIIHVGLACGFAAAQAVVRWQLGLFRPPMPVSDLLAFSYFVRDAVAYLLVAAVVHARDFWQLWREQQVRAARTRAELARAAVDAVCWRIQPAVIMAALERVEHALGRNPETAENALARLGELLRLLLQEPDRHVVGVAHEVRVLEAVTDLVSGPGTIEASIETGAKAAALPRLLLLALVHRSLADARCRLKLSARREGDALSLSVLAHPPLERAAIDGARARLEGAWPGRVQQGELSGGIHFLVPAVGV